MPIPVKRGDLGELDLCMIHQAPGCSLWTNYWWGEGCMPVCRACADLPDVTDTRMREWAERDGWGPVPPVPEGVDNG